MTDETFRAELEKPTFLKKMFFLGFRLVYKEDQTQNCDPKRTNYIESTPFSLSHSFYKL